MTFFRIVAAFVFAPAIAVFIYTRFAVHKDDAADDADGQPTAETVPHGKAQRIDTFADDNVSTATKTKECNQKAEQPLQLQTLIVENDLDTWQKKIDFFGAPPYNLKLVRDERLGLWLAKYDQIRSDFREKACREARGIVLRLDDNRVVCRPFEKFFNHGEALAADIDWTTANVTRKQDGSLMKVYCHDGQWLVGTNGTIDANGASAPGGNGETFQQFFDEAAALSNFSYDVLDASRTYLFELLHPKTVIVEDHDVPAIVHLTTHVTASGEVVDCDDIGVARTESYAIESIEECIDAAKHLPGKLEGFVVRDARGHMIKVKNPTYVCLHQMHDKQNSAEETAARIVLNNEQNEMRAYNNDKRIGVVCKEIAKVEASIQTRAQHLAALWTDVVSKMPAAPVETQQTDKKLWALAIQGTTSVQDNRTFLFVATRTIAGAQPAKSSAEIVEYFCEAIVQKFAKNHDAKRADARKLLQFLQD